MKLRRITLLKLLYVYALLCLASLAMSSAHAQPLRVLLLLSNDNPSYQTFSATLQQQLPTAVLHSTHLTELASSPQLLLNNDVIVSLGLPAAEQAVLQSKLPVLSVFVPQAAYNNVLTKITAPGQIKQMGVIYLNQPQARQVDFMSALFPLGHKIGVLHSAMAHSEFGALRDALKARGGSLLVQTVQPDESIFVPLENLLNQTDVLLAMPDNALYSSGNLRNILLTTYRFGVPVIGFSASYVNAGAVAAIFASPQQIAQQAATFLQQGMQTGRWNNAQYADTFSIALNTQIARSLALTLPSEEQIRQRMNNTLRSAHD